MCGTRRLLCSTFALFATAPLFAADSVEVRAGSGDIARTVVITLEDPRQEHRVAYLNGTSSGEFGPLEGITIATSVDGVGQLTRTTDPKVLVLTIRHGSTAKVTVQIGQRLFAADASSAPGAVKSSPAPKPIPWETFVIPREQSITADLRQRALRATVRLQSPMGTGTGTIVDSRSVSEAQTFKEAINAGEELVVSAGHVTPLYLQSAELTADLFTFDGERPVSYTRVPARLLFSRFESSRDLAVLAIDPKRAPFGRMPLCTDRHWFVAGAEYLQIGCPLGRDPVAETCHALQGRYAPLGGSVSMDKGSNKGQSGGGLFSADGYLIGVCSGTSEVTTVASGFNLVSADRADRKPALRGSVTTATTIFFRPNGLRQELDRLELEARDRRGWAAVKLPVRSAYGVPKDARAGIEAAERELERAISTLPANEQERVRREFKTALRSYSEALH